VVHCVRSRNLVNEEALAHWGLSRHTHTHIQTHTHKKNIITGDKSWVFQYDPETKRQSFQ